MSAKVGTYLKNKQNYLFYGISQIAIENMSFLTVLGVSKCLKILYQTRQLLKNTEGVKKIFLFDLIRKSVLLSKILHHITKRDR